jgi:hypothetical protein
MRRYKQINLEITDKNFAWLKKQKDKVKQQGYTFRKFINDIFDELREKENKEK